MRCSVLVGVLCALLPCARQALGSPLVTYNFQIADFVQNPNSPVVYGTVPSQNSVVVINAKTLQVTNNIPIGSNPQGLAISPDGSTLYVADSGSGVIARLNTATLAVLPGLPSPAGSPSAVQIGNSNRLWVLGGGGIHQIDATTGLSTGPDLATANGKYPLIISGGNILTSPNGNSLYYGNYGLSPSNAYKYDVTTTTPSEQWVYGGGGNGNALVLNHAGSVFAYSSAGDQSHLDLLDANSGANLGAIPFRGNALAFSDDDKFLYTAIDFTTQWHRWSLTTFQQTAPGTDTASEPEELFTDQYAHLYAGELGETEVFGVPDPVLPEPASGAVLAGGAAVLLLRRRGRAGC